MGVSSGAAQSVAIHIFRRDLRLEDNLTLQWVRQAGVPILPLFVFDPRQIEPHSYRSLRALLFMQQSLCDVASELRAHRAQLYIAHGSVLKTLSLLTREVRVVRIGFMRDYTPFALKRDGEVLQFASEQGIECCAVPDALLTEPEQVQTGGGTPYSVFTPFYNAAQKLSVAHPIATHNSSDYFNSLQYFTEKLDSVQYYNGEELSHLNIQLPCIEGLGQAPGGSIAATKTVNSFISKVGQYDVQRDYPSVEGVSRLSAHLKFGTISVRTVFHVVKNGGHYEETAPFLRQLYWRDFFTHVAFHVPRVFGSAYHQKYDALEWSNDAAALQAWKEGLTGFPIIDAGMRQLKYTGYMHNRVRLLCASFLVKDLWIDWREGEKHFAQSLIDYDPAVNNGNWQWCASTGCDAAPYFRIFNPWIQQKKFDGDCDYIKRYVPELAPYTPKQIHDAASVRFADYASPMVEHALQVRHTKRQYAALKG